MFVKSDRFAYFDKPDNLTVFDKKLLNHVRLSTT